MNKVLLSAVMCLWFAPVLAQEDSPPIIYERMVIRLVPKPEVKVITASSPLPDPKPMEKKLPSKKEAAGKEKAPATPEDEEDNQEPAKAPSRTPIDFTVEVKLPSFLEQDDFISHNAFADHQGLLITIDPPAKTSLTATHMVGKSDVLFINEDGLITRIAPNLSLAELSEPIPSTTPVRALLFIKAGGAVQDGIMPGDHFEHAMFKTHPVVLQ